MSFSVKGYFKWKMLKAIYKYIKRYWRAMVWYAVVFFGMLLEWWLMKEGLDIAYTNSFGTLLKAIGDVALILFPYWLLKAKWRWTALLPMWMMAIWGVVNLAYFRFWNVLIPPAAVMMGGNMDANLIKYGAALLRWYDIWMLIICIGASIAVAALRPAKSPSLKPRMKGIFVGASLIIGVVGQASYFKSSYSWSNALMPMSVCEGLKKHFISGRNVQRDTYMCKGLVYYGLRYVYDVAELLKSTLDLTDEQRDEIASFLSIYERRAITYANCECAPGSVMNLDSLNVVYIIVESLNADMVGRRIAGTPVMPTLDSMARRTGTVVFDNVVSQTKVSSSSDGHLLLMTGLLPPDKAAYSIMYGSQNRFPSIADVLPSHHKYLLLADEGVSWNEGSTLRNFGLGEPLAIKDRPEYPVEKWGRDGAMFKQAIEMMTEVKQPFFMTLMTISMHIPFREEAWPLPEDLANVDGMSQMERDYANMCRNTDRWIGEFLKSIPEKTLIIIASDHHQEIASNEAGDTRAFFMAINSGRTARVSRTVGQVNLFPATLDILGIEKGYGGLAPSAFDERVDGTMDSYGKIYGKPSQGALDTLRRAYEISDIIIRGDYFKE